MDFVHTNPNPILYNEIVLASALSSSLVLRNFCCQKSVRLSFGDSLLFVAHTKTLGYLQSERIVEATRSTCV
jgi:hypothetical protein